MAGSFAGMSHALVAPHLQRRGRTWKDGMADNEPQEDPKSPHDVRLASLDERLRRAQADEAARTVQPHWNATGFFGSSAWRVLSVLIGYPPGAALIGVAIDYVAGTNGIWVVMLFVGFGAAIWEVWKISQQKPE